MTYSQIIQEFAAFNGPEAGGGDKDLQNLSHLYSFMNYRCFHGSSSRTLNMTLLLATQILYFGPLRGVMKIRIAVTLVVLGLLYFYIHIT